MALILHPQQIAAVYECLRAFPPFRTWGLPHADEVEFRVSRRDEQGRYTRYVRTGPHIIEISSKKVGHYDTLVRDVAHEITHLKQALDGTEPKEPGHNAEFWRLSRQVCRSMGWDERAFV